MKICEYGCGQEAKIQLKNGKWCCSKSQNSCLGIRKKNSESNKGESSSEETKQRMSKARMGKTHSKETKQRISKGNKGKTHSEETKQKMRHTIEKIKEKYPTFSKVEELRYNPDKPGEKEIQVHCKNYECENSKEKDGWFTPNNYFVLANRIYAIEKPDGNDGTYFYCSKHCKDTCPLYGLQSDPLKENNLSYTSSEMDEAKRRRRERDKYICQDCGGLGTEVHHLIPVKREPFLALDIDNLRTVCEECHKKHHKKGLENSTGKLANLVCSTESQKFLNQKEILNENM